MGAAQGPHWGCAPPIPGATVQLCDRAMRPTLSRTLAAASSSSAKSLFVRSHALNSLLTIVAHAQRDL
jgi:hypothetical protein